MANQNFRYVILEDRIPYDWDDYDMYGCVLFDNHNKSIITIKYGHGTDMEYRNDSIELFDAVSNNIVSIEDILYSIIKDLNIGFTIERLIYMIKETAINRSLDNPIDIPVTIVNGRKGKGVEGHLVYGYRVYDQYGWGKYHNGYTDKAVVLNPNTGEFIIVNSFDYLKFDDKFIEKYSYNIIDNIDKTLDTVIKLAHAYAYRMSYSACDTKNYRSLIESYSCKGIDISNIELSDTVKNAIKKYNEAKRLKREERKKEEMPKIIEWVKNNTDKTGDEILKLAEHIFNKKY